MPKLLICTQRDVQKPPVIFAKRDTMKEALTVGARLLVQELARSDGKANVSVWEEAPYPHDPFGELRASLFAYGDEGA